MKTLELTIDPQGSPWQSSNDFQYALTRLSQHLRERMGSQKEKVTYIISVDERRGLP